ncbi:MAG: PAS domain S-box protein [Rhizobiales bacterium]|nr:PAS domain S-box protein [Hyphomicrobiales bacterium]
MSVLTPVRHYVDSLVHSSARQDALMAARHRAFIAPRLLGSFAAFAAIPVYLAARGVPNALEVLVFAWLVAPILIAYFISRTGRYERAHTLSSLALTGLVTVVAAQTGGIGSFAAIWLVVVPLEASLSASRRVVALASTFALAAAGLLLLLDAINLVPASATASDDLAALAALSIISAALYATGLALGAESLARTSIWLFYEEEDRYRLLARNMTDVITRHGRHGAVLFVSPAAEPLFGVTVRSLLGHGLFERVHVADRPAYLKALSDAAASGDAQSAEFRVKRDLAADRLHVADPFIIWIEMRCRPLDHAVRSRNGQETQEVVAVMRDVTGRKSQEQALEDARAESERANAAKDRFLANMSHELRTPLNVIIGFSEMLTKEGPMMLNAQRRQSYAQLINESGHHLLSVVNGILDMSKIDNGNFEIMPEPFAADRVVATCCDLMTLKAAETGIELALRIAPDVPEIVADKRAFNQILLNLLSNAIKFTDRGGRVTVSALRDDAMIAVAVADTGVGIGTDDLPRLGDPFFQAGASYDRRHDGTGLGLSIVKGLVDLHSGTLEIRSRLGAGTTVTVRLPIDCERVRPRSPVVAAAPKGVVEALAPKRIDPPVRKIA